MYSATISNRYIYAPREPATTGTPDAPRTLARVRSQRQMVDYEGLADYPNLVEVVGGHVSKVGYDYEREFLFGLNVILDGLERC